MTFDELQKNWRSQQPDPKLAIEPEILLREVKRNKESFESGIFWRDVNEVGISILLFVFFLYCGIRDKLWPMWLLAFACLWIAVFMVVDRKIQKRKQPCLSDAMLSCLESSLAQINHQIWLLKNVLWWYLAPLGIGLLIAFVHCGISEMIEGRLSMGTVLFLLRCIFGTILLYWGIYWLNQRAVRKELVPRKDELEEILNSLSCDKS